MHEASRAKSLPAEWRLHVPALSSGLATEPLVSEHGLDERTAITKTQFKNDRTTKHI